MYSGLLGLYGSLADPTGQTLNPLDDAIRGLLGINAQSKQLAALTAGKPAPQTIPGTALQNLNAAAPTNGAPFSVAPVGSSGNPLQDAINAAANAAVPAPQLQVNPLPAMPQAQPTAQPSAQPQGLFAPGFTSGLRERALLGAAQGLLASSGASRLPVTMGAALANALNTSTTSTDNLVSGALRAGMGTNLLNTMQTKADATQNAQTRQDQAQAVRLEALQLLQAGRITPQEYAAVLASTGNTAATRAFVSPPQTRRVQIGGNVVTQQWDPRSNQYVNVGTGPKYAPSTNQTEAYVMNKVRAGKPLTPGEQTIWNRMQKSANAVDALIHTATSTPATPSNPQTANTNQAAVIAQAKAAIAQGASAAQVAARLKAMGINPAAAGIQ